MQDTTFHLLAGLGLGIGIDRLILRRLRKPDCGCSSEETEDASFGGINCPEGTFNSGTEVDPHCVPYSTADNWGSESSEGPDMTPWQPPSGGGGLIAPGASKSMAAEEPGRLPLGRLALVRTHKYR